MKKYDISEALLKETICGFHLYQLEEPVHIISAGKSLCDMVGYSEEELTRGAADLYARLVHPSDKERYKDFLSELALHEKTATLEYRLICKNGKTIYVKDTLTSKRTEDGSLMGISTLTDISDMKKGSEGRLCLETLVSDYDKIFEYDTGSKTVKCIYSNDSPMFKWTENIPLPMEDITEKWIASTVVEEDQEAVRSFFRDFHQKKFYQSDEGPPQITYRAISSSREIKPYTGIFLKVDDTISLYCCRCTQEAENADSKALPENCKVSIRTFGYFDVFVDDKPIAFRSQKSKELFALLVDRRGGFVSSEEAISFLWEDESVNHVTLARYRKVALRLKNILEEYGISQIVETIDGKRRIVPENVQCDLYDYLTGKQEFSQLFKGSYLSNYSWGETTLGELTGKIHRSWT